MFIVPALTAVTRPEVAFTVATAVLLELHAPPALPVLVYVAVAPIQSGVVPLTVPALALGLTVTVVDADADGPLQPLAVTLTVAVPLNPEAHVTVPVVPVPDIVFPVPVTDQL